VTIIGWNELISGTKKIEGEVALSIGVFDGLHTGHRALLASITDTEGRLSPVVITFRVNPAAILGTKIFAGNITSLAQRAMKLEMSGIRFAVMIDFSFDFSKITGGKFIALLKERLAIKKVAVGYNFSFGYKRDMNAEKLSGLLPGVKVSVIEPVYFCGEIVSSTRIRNEIRAGNFESVRAMIGGNYTLDLRDGSAFEPNDRMISIDTASINQVLPEAGLYAVNILCSGTKIQGYCEIRTPRMNVELKELKHSSSIDAIEFIEKQNGRSKPKCY
jgi:riboflavin kinase/FMN adenylyltransferase